MKLLEGEIIASRKEMKAEAIRRMKKLGLNKKFIQDFEKENKITCTRFGNPEEIPEEILKRIKDFEDKFGNLCFFCIHSTFSGPFSKHEIYDFPSVSIYSDDWDFENKLIENGWIMVRGENLKTKEFSESGSIRFLKENGALIRFLAF